MKTSQEVRDYLTAQLEEHNASILWLSHESGVPYATVHNFLTGSETSIERAAKLLAVFDAKIQLVKRKK